MIFLEKLMATSANARFPAKRTPLPGKEVRWRGSCDTKDGRVAF